MVEEDPRGTLALLYWEFGHGSDHIRYLADGEPRSDVQFSGGPRCVAFSANGEQLAWAGLDRSIHLCDAENGREIAGIRGHADRITRVSEPSEEDAPSRGSVGLSVPA